MYILAIDTSASAVGAAIADAGGLIGQLELAAGRQASETLLPLTKSLLSLTGLTLADMDALAVTVGPGSFTGLRIGLATAKAWSQALAKPLVAVSTLEALAFNAVEDRCLVCPIINAQRGELYAALFAEGKRLLDDMLITPKALARRLNAYKERIIFCGDGFVEFGAQLAYLMTDKMLPAPLQRQNFIAGATAIVGRGKYLRNKLADPITLEPAYMRPAAAEELRLGAKRHG